MVKSQKEFPPGTFIPTSKRIIAILQLCIALSLFFWYIMQPFMGEYFALRSRMLPYEFVMGTSNFGKNTEGLKEKQERQAIRFQNLSEKDKELILQDYHSLQDYSSRPVWKKFLAGIQTILVGIPPFEQAWIFFSIVISILILLKHPGATTAAWILPLLVIAYAADNLSTGISLKSPDQSMIPTEHYLIGNYLHEPFSSSPLEQSKQLQHAWNNYLIAEWSSPREASTDDRLEEGEFRFTLARLYRFHGHSFSDWLNVFHQKLSPLTLLIFFLWNIFFAGTFTSKPPNLQADKPSVSKSNC